MAARYCARASLQVSCEPERGKMLTHFFSLWPSTALVSFTTYAHYFLLFASLAFFICPFAAVFSKAAL
jgi:hypothetical protein